MKCEVPSFVADFVVVEMWLDSAGNTYLPGSDYGNECDCYLLLLHSSYSPNVTILFLQEAVIVYTYDSTVVHQFYQSRVIDEFVLRGNTATIKCLIPSFVADFVQVVEWVTDDGSFAASPTSDTNYGNKKRCHLSFPYPPDSKHVFSFAEFLQQSFFSGLVDADSSASYLYLWLTLACCYSCESVLWGPSVWCVCDKG